MPYPLSSKLRHFIPKKKRNENELKYIKGPFIMDEGIEGEGMKYFQEKLHYLRVKEATIWGWVEQMR